MKFKIMELNAENLAINWEKKAPPTDLINYPEDEWQKHTSLSIPNKNLVKIHALAEAVLDESPDVLAVVEVMGNSSLKNFNHRFLDDKYHVLHSPTNSSRGIDLGFLVKKDCPYKMQIVSRNHRPVFLSDGSQRKFSRGVAELRLFHEEDKPLIIILLVHFKSQISSPDDLNGFDQRKGEARSVVDLYNELKARYSQAQIIITGDFNGWAGAEGTDEEFKPIHQKTDLVELHDHLGSKLEDRASHVFFRAPFGEAQANQLDYIFMNPLALSNLVVKESYAYRYKYFGYPWPLIKAQKERDTIPSDHYPQVAVFNFPD